MGYFRDNIDSLNAYAPGFQPKSPDAVKLNTNENPYPPSEKVMRALRGIDPVRLRRYPEPLAGSFRNAAAEVLGVGPENIIATNGGDDLLTICVRAFCQGGRGVAYPSPTYSLYPVLAGIQGCDVFEADWKADWGLCVDELAGSGAGLVIVCNPNAPSGSFVEPGVISELAAKLKDKSVLLVDEAYADFAGDNCLKLIGEHDNVIVLRSMSKGYSLAGLRFGFGLGCVKLIEGLMKVKDSYNVNTVSIAAATAAIEDQDYFRFNVDKVVCERARLGEALAGLGMDVQKSSSNFLWAGGGGKPAEVIFERLCERDIYVRYWPGKQLGDRLRITVGTRQQNDVLIDAIEEILEA